MCLLAEAGVPNWSLGPRRLLQNFDGFPGSLTGLCYCGVTRALWAASGGPKPLVYDMHTGTNISEIVQTKAEGLPAMRVQRLWYFPETRDLVVSRRPPARHARLPPAPRRTLARGRMAEQCVPGPAVATAGDDRRAAATVLAIQLAGGEMCAGR